MILRFLFLSGQCLLMFKQLPIPDHCEMSCDRRNNGRNLNYFNRSFEIGFVGVKIIDDQYPLNVSSCFRKSWLLVSTVGYLSDEENSRTFPQES